MTTLIVCPECNQRLRAREESIGTLIQCPKCRCRFRAGETGNASIVTRGSPNATEPPVEKKSADAEPAKEEKIFTPEPAKEEKIFTPEPAKEEKIFTPEPEPKAPAATRRRRKPKATISGEALWLSFQDEIQETWNRSGAGVLLAVPIIASVCFDRSPNSAHLIVSSLAGAGAFIVYYPKVSFLLPAIICGAMYGILSFAGAQYFLEGVLPNHRYRASELLLASASSGLLPAAIYFGLIFVSHVERIRRRTEKVAAQVKSAELASSPLAWRLTKRALGSAPFILGSLCVASFVSRRSIKMFFASVGASLVVLACVRIYLCVAVPQDTAHSRVETSVWKRFRLIPIIMVSLAIVCTLAMWIGGVLRQFPWMGVLFLDSLGAIIAGELWFRSLCRQDGFALPESNVERLGWGRFRVYSEPGAWRRLQEKALKSDSERYGPPFVISRSGVAAMLASITLFSLFGFKSIWFPMSTAVGALADRNNPAQTGAEVFPSVPGLRPELASDVPRADAATLRAVPTQIPAPAPAVPQTSKPAVENPPTSTPPDPKRKQASPAPPPRQSGPQTPPPASELPGLVAYWSFDEIARGIAPDSSGNLHAAKVVTARQVAGIRGKALQFNGRDSYVDYGVTPAFNIASGAAFTYAVWIKTGALSGAVVSQRNQRDGAAVLDILVSAGRLRVRLRQDGNEFVQPVELSSTEVINDQSWHHFTVTRDTSGKITLFIDTQAQATSTDGVGGMRITTNLRALGCEGYWFQRRQIASDGVLTMFDGALDEFCIFDRALLLDEVRKLAGR